MALQPGTIVTSLLFLLMVQDSWQQRRDFTNCPTDSLDYPDVPENPQTTITLFTASNARLELADSADGYLGLTSGNHTVYIAKDLDYEVKPDISGSVRCFDTTYPNGITLTVHIIVQDVNEYPPQFKNASYSVSIGEDTAVGATVFRFKGEATDRDTTPNQYISYSVSKNPTFSIANSQEGGIVLNTPLDFENGPRTFVLNISAIESTGNPRPLSNTTTLTINVSDVDDLGPVFNNTSYTLTIDERTYNGRQYRTVPPLAAVDGDTLRAVINLTLDASSMNQFGSMFEVKTDGTIAVTGAVYPGNFTINVRAFQQNRPSDRFIITTVFVSVRDINDNSPSMSRSSYTAEVSEEARSGSCVVAVSATDLDQGNNAHFLFHLDNNNNNMFNISTEGTLGTITVAKPLDRETHETYTLQVYAQEDLTSEKRNSSKSTVTITILPSPRQLRDVGGIVGGILAALIVVVFAVGAFFVVRNVRRRRPERSLSSSCTNRRRDEEDEDDRSYRSITLDNHGAMRPERSLASSYTHRSRDEEDKDDRSYRSITLDNYGAILVDDETLPPFRRSQPTSAEDPYVRPTETDDSALASESPCDRIGAASDPLYDKMRPQSEQHPYASLEPGIQGAEARADEAGYTNTREAETHQAHDRVQENMSTGGSASTSQSKKSKKKDKNRPKDKTHANK